MSDEVSINYKDELVRDYELMKEIQPDGEMGRTEYLSDYIFDFTTYESYMASLFAKKAIEVCKAITDRETFEYIKTDENRQWYLIMVNMPFFVKKLDWGGSIRGAWWDFREPIVMSQMVGIPLDQWDNFIRAMIEFQLEEVET